jgi:hypothetical protein
MKKVEIKHAMQQLVLSVLDTVEGDGWPTWAEFSVQYRIKTWPMPWDEGHRKYFETEESMWLWLEEQRDWASLEDNGISYSIEKWAWGPQFVSSGEFT